MLTFFCNNIQQNEVFTQSDVYFQEPGLVEYLAVPRQVKQGLDADDNYENDTVCVWCVCMYTSTLLEVFGTCTSRLAHSLGEKASQKCPTYLNFEQQLAFRAYTSQVKTQMPRYSAQNHYRFLLLVEPRLAVQLIRHQHLVLYRMMC